MCIQEIQSFPQISRIIFSKEQSSKLAFQPNLHQLFKLHGTPALWALIYNKHGHVKELIHIENIEDFSVDDISESKISRRVSEFSDWKQDRMVIIYSAPNFKDIFNINANEKFEIAKLTETLNKTLNLSMLSFWKFDSTLSTRYDAEKAYKEYLEFKDDGDELCRALMRSIETKIYE